MKNTWMKVALIGIGVSTMSLGSITVKAETALKTTTDAEFTAGDRPDPVKPEEGNGGTTEPTPVDPDVDPDTGEEKPLPEAGNVYVTHLPTISFGTGNKISTNGTEYEALTEKRTKDNGATAFYMPHSVQVADLSGSTETKWSVTVQQDDVYQTSSGKTLDNTRIRIYENTLTNTTLPTADITAGVKGLELTGDHAMIPVATKDTTTAPLEVMGVSVAGTTNNTATSAVFSKDYVETAYDETKTPEAARYTGIRLNVPQADQSKTVKEDKYTANLTWTLSVTP